MKSPNAPSKVAPVAMVSEITSIDSDTEEKADEKNANENDRAHRVATAGAVLLLNEVVTEAAKAASKQVPGKELEQYELKN